MLITVMRTFGCVATLLLLGCVGSESPYPTQGEAAVESGSQSGQATGASPDSQVAGNSSVESDPPAAQEIILDQELATLLQAYGSGTTDIEQRRAASDQLRQRAGDVLGSVSDWLLAGNVVQRQGVMLFLTGQAQQHPIPTEVAVHLGLQDADAKVRSIAIQLIRQLLPQQTVKLQNVLLAKISDSDEEPFNRVAIIRLLAVVPGDRSTVESEVETLAIDNEQPREVQQAALQTYVRFAPAEPAIARLISVLETSNHDDVKRTAAVLVGKYGSKSKAAVNILAQQLESADEDLRDAAAEALARIGSPAIPALAAAIRSKQRPTRQIAIYTLGVIGPSAHEHVETIAALISADDEDTSAIAKEAIVRILQK